LEPNSRFSVRNQLGVHLKPDASTGARVWAQWEVAEAIEQHGQRTPRLL
jgi:hypothetical protein